MPKYKVIISRDFIRHNYNSKKRKWMCFWESKKTGKTYKKKIIKIFEDYKKALKFYDKIALWNQGIRLKYIKKDKTIIDIKIFCIGDNSGYSVYKANKREDISYLIKYCKYKIIEDKTKKLLRKYEEWRKNKNKGKEK